MDEVTSMMNDQVRFYQDKLNYEIDSWDLSIMVKNGEDLVILDVRSREKFDEEHIEGAISFPHGEMNSESTSSLNKNALFVTYCDGIGCNGSTKGALKMVSLGFKVKELIGGFDWWKRDGHKTSAVGDESSHAQCGCASSA
jgi:rhodanese-related sulfurtransferase